MKLKHYIHFVLCLLIGTTMLTGCIEEFEADLPEEETDLLVVEGTIRSYLNTFTLSRSLGINSDVDPKMVKGARVSVQGTDGSVIQCWDMDDGQYFCWIDSLSPDVKYYLHIETDAEVYESEPQKPLPTEQIADVSGMQPTPYSDIDILVTPEEPFDANKTNYYSWSYEETWEVQPEVRTTIVFDMDLRKPVYDADQFPYRGWKDGSSKTIMVGSSKNYEGQHIRRFKIYDIGRSNERIYYRYSANLEQRAITRAEYEYELARRQAGTEMGGLFTPLPSALPSNIHCVTSKKRVIGFVGCSMNVSYHRFFLDAPDYSIDHKRPDLLLKFEDCDEQFCCDMVNKGLYLCQWNDNRMSPGGTLNTSWATERNLDVRLQGAYIEEPYFW